VREVLRKKFPPAHKCRICMSRVGNKNQLRRTLRQTKMRHAKSISNRQHKQSDANTRQHEGRGLNIFSSSYISKLALRVGSFTNEREI
jgi:hypothetical protein